MNKRLSFSIILFFQIIVSCKKDAVPEASEYPFIVFTKITEISSEGATLHANITYLGNQEILDHGFVFDKDPTTPTINCLVRSLGTNVAAGEFICRVNTDLEKGKTYNVRAFIKTNKVIVYSNICSFKSEGCPPPEIDSIYPASGTAGCIVTIIGKYFSLKPSNNKVYFGAIQANAVRSSFDKIYVQCPNTFQTLLVNLKLEVAKQTTEAKTNFELINPWIRLSEFPGNERYDCSSFVIDSKGYVTLGSIPDNLASTELWEYDYIMMKWDSLRTFPGRKRRGAIGFNIDNIGYIGLGHPNDVTLDGYKDLWSYNPSLNNWSKLADFPGNYAHYRPAYFVLNNLLYLCVSEFDSELWRYDPSIDQWTEMQIDETLNSKWIREGFSYNSEGYLIEKTGFTAGNNSFILWKFRPEQNDFIKTDSVAIPYVWWPDDCSFVIKNKLYLSSNGNGILVEYDLFDNLLFYHNKQMARESYGFILAFNDKAILNSALSHTTFEFYPK